MVSCRQDLHELLQAVQESRVHEFISCALQSENMVLEGLETAHHVVEVFVLVASLGHKLVAHISQLLGGVRKPVLLDNALANEHELFP